MGRDKGENLGILLRVGSKTCLVGLQRRPTLLHELREERRMVIHVVRRLDRILLADEEDFLAPVEGQRTKFVLHHDDRATRGTAGGFHYDRIAIRSGGLVCVDHAHVIEKAVFLLQSQDAAHLVVQFERADFSRLHPLPDDMEHFAAPLVLSLHQDDIDARLQGASARFPDAVTVDERSHRHTVRGD